MLTIQLNPNLHRVVHMLKSVETHRNEGISPAELSLSKEESSALISTFNRSVLSKGKKRSEPRCDWV